LLLIGLVSLRYKFLNNQQQTEYARAAFNFQSSQKEPLKMAQNESSKAFGKAFAYGLVFGVAVTLIVWYAIKFF
jgi:hypothetical protein